jgi:uroporphyrinogen-III synthase
MMMGHRSPLEGKQVLVTRAFETTKSENELSKRLDALGAIVHEKPLLSIDPPSSFEDLDRALNQIDTFDWIIFASPRAVSSTLARLNFLSLSFKRAKIAAVGKSTANFLKEQGIKVDFYPSTFCAKGLVDEFPSNNLDGMRIFWPRTLRGDTTIHDGLKERGAQVVMAESYSSGMPSANENLALELDRLMLSELDIITFTSSQTVRNFVSMLESQPMDQKLSDRYPQVIVAVIGPKTAQTAIDIYGRADVVAGEYTIEGLVSSLTRHFEHG